MSSRDKIHLSDYMSHFPVVFALSKDLGPFRYQSAHRKSMSCACGIIAHILTLCMVTLSIGFLKLTLALTSLYSFCTVFWNFLFCVYWPPLALPLLCIGAHFPVCIPYTQKPAGRQKVIKSSKNCRFDYFGLSIWQLLTCRFFSCHLTSFWLLFDKFLKNLLNKV